MTRLHHFRVNQRDRMLRNGVDNTTDFGLPGGLNPPKRRQSKAVLRAELAEAMASVTRIVKCRCGHSAAVALPPSKLHARLRCSKCGAIAT